MSFASDPFSFQIGIGNPANITTGQGWSIFNAVLGWTNSASSTSYILCHLMQTQTDLDSKNLMLLVGTILSYCFYWMAVIAALVYMKWAEGRVTFFGFHSAAGKRTIARQAARAAAADITPVNSIDQEKKEVRTSSETARGSEENVLKSEPILLV